MFFPSFTQNFEKLVINLIFESIYMEEEFGLKKHRVLK